ncbi:universal stress protein [Nitratidesulfovibrio sp. HK-II]|jgi:nucleotide-binding universal stress UspA family protein|uniref:universal stress protein n=1 Tax=Nitratidesulfovibrio sp. HK-II TaxID=2009266 RepID=UPI000E2EDD34|nr:universal stress protein [Nitratidesulfovibrio sp. HK-II]GBO94976.1 universal stress protein family [Nitratidesulfovibrio sp. HK-II]HCG04206.1 universal stress protein [Desulfovibrio sp.]
MQIRKILVPVDGSDYSQRAAEYAADFAKLVGAEVVLLICRMSIPPILGQTAYDQARNSLVAQAEEVLEPCRKLLRERGVPFADRVLEGKVEVAIVDAADYERCDLIIMGSRGHSELEGLLLGSVTHRVLQMASCPVMVIR